MKAATLGRPWEKGASLFALSCLLHLAAFDLVQGRDDTRSLSHPSNLQVQLVELLAATAHSPMPLEHLREPAPSHAARSIAVRPRNEQVSAFPATASPAPTKSASPPANESLPTVKPFAELPIKRSLFFSSRLGNSATFSNVQSPPMQANAAQLSSTLSTTALEVAAALKDGREGRCDLRVDQLGGKWSCSSAELEERAAGLPAARALLDSLADGAEHVVTIYLFPDRVEVSQR